MTRRPNPTRRRRVLIAAIATAVTLGAVAAAWWLWWLPNGRPPLHAGERYGIDVSHHQGEIDWPAVRADGIEFAYIKATEGIDHADEAFARNWHAARDAGVDRGAYHFFTLCRGGAEQAAHFLTVAPPEPDALRPAVDLELAGNCDARPSVQTLDAELRAFITSVEAAWGKPILLYVGADYGRRYPQVYEIGRPLWLVRFQRRPDNDTWRVWQRHGFARVDGISGKVDLDVSRDAAR